MDRRYVRLDPGRVTLLYLKKKWNYNRFILEAAVSQETAAKEQCAGEVGKNKEHEVHNSSGEPQLNFKATQKRKLKKARAQETQSNRQKRTVEKAAAGEPVFVNTGFAIAKLLGVDLISILHPQFLDELALPSEWPNPLDFFATVGEWQVDEMINSARKAPNGLAYDTWKLRHRHVKGRLAFGKCYSLKKLSTKERAALKSYLTRHSEVCDRIGPHPHIVQNRDAVQWEHGEMWWIIDEWIDGERLDSLLVAKRLDVTAVPKVLREIALGLQTLHVHMIIRRELAPHHVWIRESNCSAVLTDLELAKLLERAPTVSPTQGWPEDEYRAIEVSPDQPLTPRADVYSWGRIAAEALCGYLPLKGQEATALAKVQVSTAVRQIILSSVALPASERPADMAVVLNAIKKWK